MQETLRIDSSGFRISPEVPLGVCVGGGGVIYSAVVIRLITASRNQSTRTFYLISFLFISMSRICFSCTLFGYEHFLSPYTPCVVCRLYILRENGWCGSTAFNKLWIQKTNIISHAFCALCLCVLQDLRRKTYMNYSRESHSQNFCCLTENYQRSDNRGHNFSLNRPVASGEI